MKQIETKNAVGHILCHDVTQIIRGVTKDAAFRKGHMITEEDIPVLLRMGKDHIYVWENDSTLLHENDAANQLYDLCKNEHIYHGEVKEGKIEAFADCDGLFRLDRQKLLHINSFGEIMIAARHGNTPVRKGDKLAGMRIIPLLIKKEKMEQAKAVCGGEPIFSVKPFLKKKAAVIATGNEIYYNRITDTFTPVVLDKLKEFGAEIIFQKVFDDNPQKITAGILTAIERGAQLVVCTGGMSVDPDDRTPLAIRNTGADLVTYGAPVLPGAMFLLSYFRAKDRIVPIMGLPGCVMYAKRTVFDLALPRIMADDPITAEEIALLGKGGLCLSCEVCRFPDCGFGKGW